MHLVRFPIIFTTIFTTTVLFVAAASVAQARQTVSAKAANGKVSIDFAPTTLRGRAATDIPVGGVWRMSAGAAAQLHTTVPLTKRGLTLAPGRYRLSARRVTEKTWELLVFSGSAIYRKGIAADKNPLYLAAEETPREELGFVVKGGSKRVRIKLHWGKHSLNTSFNAIPIQAVAGALGGKPANFTFYGLKVVGSNQTRLTNGEMLTIGTAVQQNKGDAPPVRYSIHAQRQGEAVELVFKRVPAAADRPGKTAEAAAALRERVSVQGAFEPRRNTAATLTVDGRKTDAGLQLDIGFGRNTAHFLVKNGSFAKKQ